MTGVPGMMRIFLAMFAVSLIATDGICQEPPKAMPGKPASAATQPPPAKPQPVSPVMTEAIPQTSCDAQGGCTSGCGQRTGLLARIHAHWCGSRFASIDPAACCNNNFPSYGSYTPVYAITPTNCSVQSDERCRRFGVCRFFTGKREVKEHCRPGALNRLRAWLSLGHCKSECEWKAMPTPYHAPLRYYFHPDGEPVCGTDVNYICPGGRIPTRSTADCAASEAGAGLGDRIRALTHADKCWGGNCRKEQCYGIPGSNFNGNVRYARDERSAVPTINSGKPTEYEPGYYPYYGRKSEDEKTIQQVQHKSTIK